MADTARIATVLAELLPHTRLCPLGRNWGRAARCTCLKARLRAAEGIAPTVAAWVDNAAREGRG